MQSSAERSVFTEVKDKNNQNVKVNQQVLDLSVTPQLEILCCTNINVHLTIRAIDFVFFKKKNLAFIYLYQNHSS